MVAQVPRRPIISNLYECSRWYYRLVMCYICTFLVLVSVSQPFVPVLLSEEFEFEIEFDFDFEVSQLSQCFKLKVSRPLSFNLTIPIIPILQRSNPAYPLMQSDKTEYSAATVNI